MNRILIIKIRALGDTLLATPAVHTMRQAFPHGRITFLVSSAGAPVLAGNPDLDEMIIYDKQHAGWYYSLHLMRELAARRFDVVVALHASFRTALLARATGARVRVVHNHSGANYFSTAKITARKESKSAIQRDLDAVQALGIPPAGDRLQFVFAPQHLASAEQFLEKNHLGSQPFILFIPAAGKAHKQWPIAASVDFVNRTQNSVRAACILLADPSHSQQATQINQRVQKPAPLFQGSIQEAGALMSLSAGVVTTDSGPKHVAVAVGARTVTLWTDEPEAEWHPYDRTQHALIRAASGRIEDIAVDDVVALAQRHFGLAQFGQ